MLTLQTTDSELHALRHAVNEARRSSTTVKVSREALRHLLNDHHSLYDVARKRAAVGVGNDQESLR